MVVPSSTAREGRDRITPGPSSSVIAPCSYVGVDRVADGCVLLMVAFRVTPAIASTLSAMAGIVILPDIWPANMATIALAEEAVYSVPSLAGFVTDGAVVLETATPLPPTGFTDTVNARGALSGGGVGDAHHGRRVIISEPDRR